jgi:hypothetical protein
MKLNRRFYVVVFAVLVGVFTAVCYVEWRSQFATAQVELTMDQDWIQPAPVRVTAAPDGLGLEQMDLGMPEGRVSAASR